MNSYETRYETGAVLSGSLIEETYVVFAAWDFNASKSQNFKRAEEQNLIGAKTNASLTNIMGELFSRFDPEEDDRALVVIAKAGISFDQWKPILLYHLCQSNLLIRHFFDWLFDEYKSDTFQIRTEDVARHLHTLAPWADSTTQRLASALLKMAADFGYLTGTKTKTFTTLMLPDSAFLYVLHHLRERLSTSNAVTTRIWGLFRMYPEDVQRELFRLHQYNILHFQAAGSIMELSLPCKNALDYAQRMK
jgi:hypothetical protein